MSRFATLSACSALLAASSFGALPALDISRGAFGIMNAGDQAGISELPEAYFDYLARLNMQWVAIGVTLQVQSSTDSTVERYYSNDYENFVPTIPDATLRKFAQQLHSRGYKVLLSLALDEPWPEDGTPNPALPAGKPAWRYQIGDPITPAGYTLDQWPWNPANANHAAFVASFWASYARETAHYASLCEQEGVEIFQVGAETQELFRTRAIGSRTNDFRAQIQAVVDSARAHYSGHVGYYMHSGTWKLAWHNADTLYHELWGDVGFDVIGGSMYNLATVKTTAATNTLAWFKSQFTTIFTTYFRPVVQKYPAKTVAVLELGLPIWNKASPYSEPDGAELMNREDVNGNKIIDAEEVQANMFEAYYSVADSLGYPEPGFLFGDGASTDAFAHLGSAYWGWGIRNHEAELVLMRRFRNPTVTSDQNAAPALVGKSDSNYVAVIGETFTSKPFQASDADTAQGDAILYRTTWDNFPWYGAAPSRGTVTGMPMDDDAGAWPIKLYARDMFGKVSADTAKFIVWAIHPRSSQVTSTPPTTMVPGQAVNYQITVADGSGNPITSGLSYSLTVNPYFLSVSSTGKVTGMPTFAVAGTTRAAEVRIAKTTAPTAVYYDSWAIKVIDANDPPTWGGDGNLLSPADGANLSATQPIPFRVGYANDLNDDTLSFVFHLYGPGFDTTFTRKSGVISRVGAQKWDTAQIRFALNLAGRLTPGADYSWNVKVTDKKDTLTSATRKFNVQGGPSTGLEDLAQGPTRYQLGEAAFNPFDGAATLRFAVPKAGRVSLEAYDLQGNLLGVLSQGYRPMGYYSVRFDASRFTGRLLLFKLNAGAVQIVRKGMLSR
jgi:hypothetical protein